MGNSIVAVRSVLLLLLLMSVCVRWRAGVLKCWTTSPFPSSFSNAKRTKPGQGCNGRTMSLCSTCVCVFAVLIDRECRQISVSDLRGPRAEREARAACRSAGWSVATTAARADGPPGGAAVSGARGTRACAWPTWTGARCPAGRSAPGSASVEPAPCGFWSAACATGSARARCRHRDRSLRRSPD